MIMKRFYIATVIVILMCISCSPETGILPIENASLVYVGESTETVDDVNYTVKSYADVKSSEPYFYIYYKYYYLEDNLRRLYVFNHGVGSSLDVPYTDLKEHSCAGNTNLPTVYTYHKNGEIVSVTYSFKLDTVVYKTVNKFDSEGNKISSIEYRGEKLYSEYSYYSNGNEKSRKYYNIDADPIYIAEETSYFESGNIEKDVRYYSNGYIESSSEYYDSSSHIEKVVLRYNTDGTLISETYRREDGTFEKANSSYGNGSAQKETYYESGNRKTRVEYYSNGKIAYSYEYYDSFASIEKTCLQYNQEGVLLYERCWNADGSLNSEKQYYDDGTLKSEVICYDSGNKKTSTSYYKNNQIEYKTEYYDSYSSIEKSSLRYSYEGVLLSEAYRNSDGTMSSEKRYNNSGAIESETVYYESGFSKIGTTYYSNGQIESKTEFYDLSSSPTKMSFNYTYEGVLVEERYYNSNGTYSLSKTYYETSGTLKSKSEFYNSGFIKKKETHYSSGKIEYSYDYYDSSLGIEKVSLHYNSDGTLDSEVYCNSSGSRVLIAAYKDDETVRGFIYYYDDESVKYYYENGFLFTYESGKVTSPSTSEGIYKSKISYTDAEAKTKLDELRPQ